MAQPPLQKPAKRRRRGFSSRVALWRWCAVGLVMLSSAACATSSGASNEAPTGLRAGFEQIRLERVVVAPFFSVDPFGLDPDARRAMIGLYEDSAMKRLGGLGADVISPGDVREALKADEREGELRERLDLDRPLTALFEPSAKGAPNALEDERALFVRELAARFEADAVLLGEVVYHTEAKCAAGKRLNAPHRVRAYIGPPPKAKNVRVPCVVSHFQAKLIDPTSGATVWFNRALSETLASTPDAATPPIDANAREAVARVLLDARRGVGRLLKAR